MNCDQIIEDVRQVVEEYYQVKNNSVKERAKKLQQELSALEQEMFENNMRLEKLARGKNIGLAQSLLSQERIAEYQAAHQSFHTQQEEWAQQEARALQAQQQQEARDLQAQQQQESRTQQAQQQQDARAHQFFN